MSNTSEGSMYSTSTSIHTCSYLCGAHDVPEAITCKYNKILVAGYVEHVQIGIRYNEGLQIGSRMGGGGRKNAKMNARKIINRKKARDLAEMINTGERREITTLLSVHLFPIRYSILYIASDMNSEHVANIIYMYAMSYTNMHSDHVHTPSCYDRQR